jgi:hypothetical protein
MKNLLLLFSAAVIIISCNQKKKDSTAKRPDKNTGDTTYLISKYGFGQIKIGMTQSELEKILTQRLNMKHAKDSEEPWSDTAIAKYKDIDISLYFQPRYNEDQDAPKIMELYGLATSSPLCKTAAGIGIGDDKVAVVSSYDENSINMGPEYEQVNDSTWLPSKTKYTIHVSNNDDERELFFNLLNKKIASFGVSIVIGD